MPTASRKDPERLFNGSFETFGEAVGQEGLHLAQCAVRWLEALTISPDASYMKEQWAKEFLDTAMAVAMGRSPMEEKAFRPLSSLNEWSARYLALRGAYELREMADMLIG